MGISDFCALCEVADALSYLFETKPQHDKEHGRAEYSYFFVLEYLRLMLNRRPAVYSIAIPNRKWSHYEEARPHAGKGRLLSFAPTHPPPSQVRCPTMPFCWEFDTLPQEVWDNEPRHDGARCSPRSSCVSTIAYRRCDHASMARFQVRAIRRRVRSVPARTSELSRELIVSGPVRIRAGMAEQTPRRSPRYAGDGAAPEPRACGAAATTVTTAPHVRAWCETSATRCSGCLTRARGVLRGLKTCRAAENFRDPGTGPPGQLLEQPQ